MKLGELATFKDISNRTNAQNMDTINRLETARASERNDYQCKINELNTLISFREADYRLVCSELARIKEEAAANRQFLNG